MKKYIRASFSESTPSWLLQDFKRGRWDGVKDKILNKYHVALDKAEYSDTPTENSIPIYLLQTDYGNIVYCPGANDDETTLINGRQRKLGSIAKSKLPEMALDTVYVQLDGDNVAPRKERYRDPRRTYRYAGPQGKYAGQYKRTRYDSETREDVPDGWSEKGMTPSNESRARDKSGYIIPSPEQRLAQFYSKFPEKLTGKVDELYQKLLDTRKMLSETDFNSPRPSWRDNDREFVDYSKATRRFADAVDDYRQLLVELQDIDRSYDRGYAIHQFANTVRNITERVDDVQRLLAGDNSVW